MTKLDAYLEAVDELIRLAAFGHAPGCKRTPHARRDDELDVDTCNFCRSIEEVQLRKLDYNAE